MKTTQSSIKGIGRFGACLVAILGLGAPTASALTSVSIPLAGLEIGNGITINVNSGAKRLDPATAYTYKVVGTCHGTVPSSMMYYLAPSPISLKALLNSFKAGSGKFLSGTVSNPSGTFPFKAINKPYSRTVATNFGDATFEATIVAGVRGGTRAGQAYFTISAVNIVPPYPVTIGTLMFDPGAKLVISVAP